MHLSVSAALTLLLGAPPLLAQATLGVRQVFPEGELRPSSSITITFSRPLAGTLERLRDPSTIVRIVPALPARVEWRDPGTLRIIPDEPLQPGTRLSLHIDSLTAPDGTRLNAPWARELRVRQPTIVGSHPFLRPGYPTALDPTGRILLRMNGAIDTAVMARSARLEPTPGTECAARASSLLFRVAVRSPDSTDPWTLNHDYGVVARDSIERRFDRIIELTPLMRPMESCSYDLVLRLPDEGTLSDIRYRVATSGPFSVHAQCSNPWDCAASPQHLDLVFSAPVSWSELRRTLRVRPEGRLSLPDSGPPQTAWRLRMRATPGDTLGVDFMEDLQDTFGRALTTRNALTVPIGDRLPVWSASGGLVSLPRNARPFVRIRHVNIDSLWVTVYRVTRSPVGAFNAAWGGRVDSLLLRGDSIRYLHRLGVPRNEERESAIPITVPDPEWRNALLAVRLEAVKPSTRTGSPFVIRAESERKLPVHTFLVQRTDLMVHTRVGMAGGGVLITNLRSGAPVPNAAVQLYDANLDVVARGRTDGRGVALLRVTPSFNRRVARRSHQSPDIEPDDPAWPFEGVVAVEAQLGADRSFAMVAPGGRTVGYSPVNYRRAVRRRAVITTDRDIYRPGELTYFHAIVRDGWLEELAASRRERVRWRVVRTDMNGEGETLLLEREATLTSFGTHADSLRLPVNARLGRYEVRLERRRGNRWFVAAQSQLDVAEYRAPEFLVTGGFTSPGGVKGDTARAHFTSRLLFDAPLVDATVHWRAIFTELKPWEITIPGLGPHWTVGRSPNWWQQSEPEPVYLTGSDTTGSDGSVDLAIATDTVPFSRGARLVLDASVQDVNGQSVAIDATTAVAGASFYLASRAEGRTWWWRVGQEETLRVGAITGSGTWVNGVKTIVTVKRNRWEYHDASGNRVFRMVTDTLQRDSLVTRDSSAMFAFTPQGEGILEVEFTALDPIGREAATSTSRWVLGDGRGSWWNADPLALPIFLERDSVRSGDKVTLTFSSPYPSAQAWITVEREGMLHQERVTVPAGPSSVTLTVNDRWIPRATVGVLLVRMGDMAATDSAPERYRLGTKWLAVDAAARRLQVALTPRDREYRPGATATIDVRLTDHKGQPVSGEAALWASDEGVLSLTGYTLPDVAETLYASAFTNLAFATTLTSLVRHLSPLPPGQPNFSGRGLAAAASMLSAVVTTGTGVEVTLARAMMMPMARSDFRSTAFYRSRIRTDADGRASVDVKLPENLTTFRLMAIAVDAGARAGGGVGQLLVTKPLLVRASMPRFVRPADTFRAGGVVNTRGRNDTLTVRAMATGDTTLRLSGAAQRDIAAGPEGTLANFDWIAGRGKDATVTLGAVSGNLDDAVRLTLPVRPDQHRTAHTLVALVRDSTTFRFSLPADVDPARSRLTMRVGPTPLPVIRTYASHLEAYPYACTEQLTSAGMAMVALLKLERAGATRLDDSAELRGRLERVVNLVSDRQRADGSFGYWSRASWYVPWLDSYVGAFLLDARELGIPVQQVVVNLLGHALQRDLDMSPLLPNLTYGTRAESRRLVAHHLSQRLAAADYLARATNAYAHVDEIFTERSRLTFEDRARLAHLLSRRSGRASQAREMLTQLWNQVSIAGNRVDFPESTMVTTGFPSRIRPAARLLLATQSIDPRHPGIGPLAQRIIQRERAEQGLWWNTQDYAFAAGAVASFITGEASARASFILSGDDGRVLMEGQAGSDARELEVDLSELTLAAGDSVVLPIQVRAQEGPVYVTLTVSELRRERPVSPDTKGLVVERWYERVTDGTTVTEVSEGDLVRVRLRVTAPGDREFVAVNDPLPAGLEAVDTKLRTTSVHAFLGEDAIRSERQQDVLAGGSARTWEPWGWYTWSWNPWDDVETYDDRVIFVARTLGGGSHTYSYIARATTPGRFVRPQALAEEMYNPALSGRSDGGWFVVKARPQE